MNKTLALLAAAGIAISSAAYAVDATVETDAAEGTVTTSTSVEATESTDAAAETITTTSKMEKKLDKTGEAEVSAEVETESHAH